MGGRQAARCRLSSRVKGIDVVVLEREEVPRFHIGESLITETYWTFERLGMLERLKSSDFPAEVQRAVHLRERQGVPAVLLLRA